MAKTATRRRKSSARSKGRGGGSALPWAIVGVIAVGGIATYDNWKNVKPMLATHASASLVSRPASLALSEPARDSSPKQTASITAAARMIPPAAVPIPAKAPAVPEKAIPASISLAQAQTGKAAFGYCGQGEHINCVADGGTFWYKGEKIAIADVVSPGIETARCDNEKRLGFAAKLRLLNILNAGSFSMNPAGQPGKAGAPHVVSRDGRSIGVQMIDEGLARKPGATGAWCA
jgi:endonuclease YncB( thermonuclease family)